MKVGIFFGGPSREREISFAGGRTVYDNLDRALFTPVPIFVDSLGNFILLRWRYLYQGSIRDFYPPTDRVPVSDFQVYVESLDTLSSAEQEALISHIGQRVTPDQFEGLFDIAFLALHGPYGEDGALQGMLEWLRIPYTGTGILGSVLGIDKVTQKQWMQQAGLAVPAYEVLSEHTWQTAKDREALLQGLFRTLGCPLVVKSPRQGSSIGVSIVKARDTVQLATAIDRSLFVQEVTAAAWRGMSQEAKQRWLTALVDLREGIGLPVSVHSAIIEHPDALWQYLDEHFKESEDTLKLISIQGEEAVLLEAYISGKEFSCIVLEPRPGHPVALPPTEMLKGDIHFDYRAKYLPGIVRKQTPIALPLEQVQAIRKACENLFRQCHFQVYARIDGFLTPDNEVYLNDPNTTAGMNPSSFLFHQAAEIGLNPTQLLTFLIRNSLATRIHTNAVKRQAPALLARLDAQRNAMTKGEASKTRVGVIMGGFSAERHISVESGRNIYEKLASSVQYTPIPIFLSGTPAQHQLFVLPISMLLKDNADDIHAKLMTPSTTTHEDVLDVIRQDAAAITDEYATPAPTRPEAITYEALAARVDFVFIALHGRPGEDGTLQSTLEAHGLPYNGSGVESMRRTMDKFETNQFLRTQGVLVADQVLVTKALWEQDRTAALHAIEAQLQYPMIAKPVDEGCSAAVIKINDQAMLVAYAEATFRTTPSVPEQHREVLGLRPQDEFPRKAQLLAEALVDKGDAKHFLEITGGLLTHREADGGRRYQMFLPSEAVTTGEVLSLEEKFLAGEGQNITPARFHPDAAINQQITQQVQADLQRVAHLLDVEGYARIDAFVKVYDPAHVETWIIEVNALPGMTPATCIFHQCALSGYTPFEFIHQIIQYGIVK